MGRRRLNTDTSTNEPLAKLTTETETETEPDSFNQRAPLIPSGIDQFAAQIGGLQRFIQGCRLVNNDKAKRICQLYQNAVEDGKGKHIRLEDLCIAVDIDPNILIGNVFSALYAQGNMSARVLSAINLPGLVEASVKRGKEPAGVEDRRMQFEIGGLLHDDRGININLGGPLIAPEGIPVFEDDTKSSAVDAEFKVVEDQNR